MQGDDAYRLEAFDFGRRMAVEREYRAAAGAPPSNVIFDASGRYLIYPSPLGIKVISIATSKLARLLGKVENTERFAMLALFQGRAKVTNHAVAQAPDRCRMACMQAVRSCQQHAVRPCLLCTCRLHAPLTASRCSSPRVPQLGSNMIGSGVKITEEV